MMFIAYDVTSRCVWGYGETPDKAWSEAVGNWNEYSYPLINFRKNMSVAPATAELITLVEGYGGAEASDKWAFSKGFADLSPEMKDYLESLNADDDEPLNKND